MSLREGTRLKIEGQHVVAVNESEAWRSEALALLNEFATLNHEVRADEFDKFRRTRQSQEPHHPNVIGTLFSTAASKGWIIKTSRYGVSEKSEARAHSYVIWKSTICDKPLTVTVDGFFGVKADGCGGWFFDSEKDAIESVGRYAERVEVARGEVKFFRLVEGWPSGKAPTC